MYTGLYKKIQSRRVGCNAALQGVSFMAWATGVPRCTFGQLKIQIQFSVLILV